MYMYSIYNFPFFKFRYLATGTNFLSLHFDFLMGVSTIAKVIHETCVVLWDELQPTEMTPPTEENWLEIAEGFYTKTQFPNCVRAVDGKHISFTYITYTYFLTFNIIRSCIVSIIFNLSVFFIIINYYFFYKYIILISLTSCLLCSKQYKFLI